ncbi:hypothetical protein PG997_004744 [Apiospora hydei]|uniref:PCI domain-containing protein n=1 Tax=Apiospora hydei TaxID=1337664 RepID=A0ABR1X2Z2_9PEZI
MRGRGGPRGQRGGRGGGRAPSGPWSRLKPVELDPLEAIGLPSKGDNRLLDFKTQERYYTKIVERYMSFCSDAGERQELLRRFSSLQLAETPTLRPSRRRRLLLLSPAALLDPSRGTQRAPPLSLWSPLCPPPPTRKGSRTCWRRLRKLREGIVASKRADDFAVQAYLFCIRLSVLVKHPESYHPAILHLLRRIQPLHPMTSVETSEVVGYLILDTACRRNDLAEAYSLRTRYRLRDPKIDGVLDALAHDNYVLYKRLRRSVDGHKAKLLEFGEGPCGSTRSSASGVATSVWNWSSWRSARTRRGWISLRMTAWAGN